jgi:hypothetical protein
MRFSPTPLQGAMLVARQSRFHGISGLHPFWLNVWCCVVTSFPFLTPLRIFCVRI